METKYKITIIFLHLHLFKILSLVRKKNPAYLLMINSIYALTLKFRNLKNRNAVNLVLSLISN